MSKVSEQPSSAVRARDRKEVEAEWKAAMPTAKVQHAQIAKLAAFCTEAIKDGIYFHYIVKDNGGEKDNLGRRPKEISNAVFKTRLRRDIREKHSVYLSQVSSLVNGYIKSLLHNEKSADVIEDDPKFGEIVQFYIGSSEEIEDVATLMMYFDSKLSITQRNFIAQFKKLEEAEVLVTPSIATRNLTKDERKVKNAAYRSPINQAFLKAHNLIEFETCGVESLKACNAITQSKEAEAPTADNAKKFERFIALSEESMEIVTEWVNQIERSQLEKVLKSDNKLFELNSMNDSQKLKYWEKSKQGISGDLEKLFREKNTASANVLKEIKTVIGYIEKVLKNTFSVKAEIKEKETRPVPLLLTSLMLYLSKIAHTYSSNLPPKREKPTKPQADSILAKFSSATYTTEDIQTLSDYFTTLSNRHKNKEACRNVFKVVIATTKYTAVEAANMVVVDTLGNSILTMAVGTLETEDLRRALKKTVAGCLQQGEAKKALERSLAVETLVKRLAVFDEMNPWATIGNPKGRYQENALHKLIRESDCKTLKSLIGISESSSKPKAAPTKLHYPYIGQGPYNRIAMYPESETALAAYYEGISKKLTDNFDIFTEEKNNEDKGGKRERKLKVYYHENRLFDLIAKYHIDYTNSEWIDRLLKDKIARGLVVSHLKNAIYAGLRSSVMCDILNRNILHKFIDLKRCTSHEILLQTGLLKTIRKLYTACFSQWRVLNKVAQAARETEKFESLASRISELMMRSMMPQLKAYLTMFGDADTVTSMIEECGIVLPEDNNIHARLNYSLAEQIERRKVLERDYLKAIIAVIADNAEEIHELDHQQRSALIRCESLCRMNQSRLFHYQMSWVMHALPEYVNKNAQFYETCMELAMGSQPQQDTETNMVSHMRAASLLALTPRKAILLFSLFSELDEEKGKWWLNNYLHFKGTAVATHICLKNYYMNYVRAVFLLYQNDSRKKDLYKVALEAVQSMTMMKLPMLAQVILRYVADVYNQGNLTGRKYCFYLINTVLKNVKKRYSSIDDRAQSEPHISIHKYAELSKLVPNRNEKLSSSLISSRTFEKHQNSRIQGSYENHETGKRDNELIEGCFSKVQNSEEITQQELLNIISLCKMTRYQACVMSTTLSDEDKLKAWFRVDPLQGSRQVELVALMKSDIGNQYNLRYFSRLHSLESYGKLASQSPDVLIVDLPRLSVEDFQQIVSSQWSKLSVPNRIAAFQSTIVNSQPRRLKTFMDLGIDKQFLVQAMDATWPHQEYNTTHMMAAFWSYFGKLLACTYVAKYGLSTRTGGQVKFDKLTVEKLLEGLTPESRKAQNKLDRTAMKKTGALTNIDGNTRELPCLNLSILRAVEEIAICESKVIESCVSFCNLYAATCEKQPDPREIGGLHYSIFILLDYGNISIDEAVNPDNDKGKVRNNGGEVDEPDNGKEPIVIRYDVPQLLEKSKVLRLLNSCVGAEKYTIERMKEKLTDMYDKYNELADSSPYDKILFSSGYTYKICCDIERMDGMSRDRLPNKFDAFVTVFNHPVESINELFYHGVIDYLMTALAGYKYARRLAAEITDLSRFYKFIDKHLKLHVEAIESMDKVKVVPKKNNRGSNDDEDNDGDIKEDNSELIAGDVKNIETRLSNLVTLGLSVACFAKGNTEATNFWINVKSQNLKKPTIYRALFSCLRNQPGLDVVVDGRNIELVKILTDYEAAEASIPHQISRTDMTVLNEPKDNIYKYSDILNFIKQNEKQIAKEPGLLSNLNIKINDQNFKFSNECAKKICEGKHENQGLSRFAKIISAWNSVQYNVERLPPMIMYSKEENKGVHSSYNPFEKNPTLVYICMATEKIDLRDDEGCLQISFEKAAVNPAKYQTKGPGFKLEKLPSKLKDEYESTQKLEVQSAAILKEKDEETVKCIILRIKRNGSEFVYDPSIRIHSSVYDLVVVRDYLKDSTHDVSEKLGNDNLTSHFNDGKEGMFSDSSILTQDSEHLQYFNSTFGEGYNTNEERNILFMKKLKMLEATEALVSQYEGLSRSRNVTKDFYSEASSRLNSGKVDSKTAVATWQKCANTTDS